MGNSPSREQVGFGIELELTALPHDTEVSPRKKWDYRRAGFRNLQSAMAERGIEATTDALNRNGTFTKHPDDYDHWHLTQDNSLNPNEPAAIPMEAVSRKFEVPRKDWMREIRLFWSAFNEVFENEIRNVSCGTHVHIRPLGPGYDMKGLRMIAYAVVVYEKHVIEFLPEERRDCTYCRPSTSVSPALRRIFKHGRSRASYNNLRDEINDLNTPEELCTFMQGNQEGNRRVLWNFENIRDDMIGTIEFRGGPGLHSTSETIHWILFALGFILLAMDEDKLSEGDFSYVAPGTERFQRRVNELWARIKDCAERKVTRKCVLPDNYWDMMDEDPLSSSSSSISSS